MESLMSKSELEVAFLRMWDVCSKLNNVEPVQPEAEYMFAAPRKWRFDYAWPSHKVAVELEGGVWTQGRHARPAGMIGDMEKYNTAASLGWLVLRFTGNHLRKDPLTVWETIIETLNASLTAASAARRGEGERQQTQVRTEPGHLPAAD